ncbi:MAG TPA: PEGA domain-containing protein [Caldithrix sp.]|nr:PEGA domain-containing protein [Caldithrix sp.]
MGKLLNVQRIISGSIGQVGKIYTVDISLIDIQTSRIEDSFIFDHAGEIGGLVKMMEIVANDIANKVTGGQEQVEVAIKTGSISIEADPRKAEVYLDNNLIGNAPVSLKEVSPGSHTVKISAKGYDPEEKEIVINENKETKLKVELKKLYKLSVSSTPTGAKVLINNKEAGQTPYTTTIKEDMQFDLKLSLGNYKEWTKRIKVKDNIDVNEKLKYTDAYKDQLEKQARLAAEQKKQEENKTEDKEIKKGSSKWYWIGGAVAVIGGVTYYFLSQGDESSSDEGMPTPPGRP